MADYLSTIAIQAVIDGVEQDRSGHRRSCMRRMVFALLCISSALNAPGRAAGAGGCPADLVPSASHVLAYRKVAGAAGPFSNARVTLVRSNDMAGPFTGRLDVAGGRCFLLAGPEDPTGLFDFFVGAVLFTPPDRGRSNGIVILYDQVHRSPEHNSNAGALVYRVDEHGVTRLPALERRLEGARSARQVRSRLAGSAR